MRFQSLRADGFLAYPASKDCCKRYDVLEGDGFVQRHGQRCFVHHAQIDTRFASGIQNGRGMAAAFHAKRVEIAAMTYFETEAVQSGVQAARMSGDAL